ncbi:MAG: hypothetical protein UW11_C0030G0012 [Parcubacteria group bacterium GW2011_GWA2_43_9b]|nr:MAG: hypothetical protein UW11_C0030G0012 [Parcubacteria group bacterium GW2011_GWA2_43_9b]
MPALKSANTIIWLDTSAVLKLLRFFKKIIADGKNGPKNFYARGKLVTGLKHNEWDRSMRRYHELLEPFKEKTVILKSKREINDFLIKENIIKGEEGHGSPPEFTP